MMFFSILLCLLFIFMKSTQQQISEQYKVRYEAHKKTYGLTFVGDEDANRLKIFAANMAFIDKTNSEGRTYKLASNQFTHLSNEEFRTILGNGNNRKNAQNGRLLGGYHAPPLVPSAEPSAKPTTLKPNLQVASTRFPSSHQPTSLRPFANPTKEPTAKPAQKPSFTSSPYPTFSPLQNKPSKKPSSQPTPAPTRKTTSPSREPTFRPSNFPTLEPILRPSASPSAGLSNQPSVKPTLPQSGRPSSAPTVFPSKYISKVDWTQQPPYANYSGQFPGPFLNPIKNQGGCGSCYAFTSVGALETAYYLKHGVLYSFSEQYVISCDKYNLGCEEGWQDQVPSWVTSVGGIPLETTYPYVQQYNRTTAACRSNGLPLIPVSVANAYFLGLILNHNADALIEELKAAILQQPVTLSICGSSPIFQSYSSGVIADDSCGSCYDHSVVGVGYGTMGGVSYIKIRNSWGTSWGMSGYALVDPHYCNALYNIYYYTLN